MKCVSCETEINPKWGHAIEKNVCPGCGQSIMPDQLKSLLSTLKETMISLQEYPEQLNDWLLSNYNYIKTDSPNLNIYLPKEYSKNIQKSSKDDMEDQKTTTMIKLKMADGTMQDILVEKSQSEAKTNGFFERAEVLKGSGKTSGKAVKSPDEPEAPKSVVEKTQNFKKIVQQIRTESSQGFTGEAGLAKMIDQADPEAVAEFQSVIGSGDIIASGLPETYTGDDDEIPQVALAMGRLAGNKNSSDANEKDLRALHEMQAKAQGSKNRMGGKNSFSR
jgi:hypothetical protein